MKKYIAVLCLALMFCPLSFAGKPKTQTVTFNASMDCKNCVRKITENVSFEKGVRDLETDLAGKTVTITFDPVKTDTAKLANAIRKLGYRVSVKR